MSQPWRYSVMVRDREVEIPEGEATLGRSRSATVSISDPSISRIHIRLVAREGRVLLEDLGSANGTYVNGLRASGVVELGDGARLMLGESEMTLRVQKAPSPLATRRIDPKEFLCSRCGRPFPDGSRSCPQCVVVHDAAEGTKAVPEPPRELLPSIDLPPPPPPSPVRSQAPSAPRGFFGKLFGRH